MDAGVEPGAGGDGAGQSGAFAFPGGRAGESAKGNRGRAGIF